MACSGSPDRVTGGANPEQGELPPDPSFSGNITFDSCVAAINAALTQTTCWQRGTEANSNYTEVWFSPDSSTATTGVLGYEAKKASDSVIIDYTITNCDGNTIRMTQSGGITVKVSGKQLDLEFDNWDQAYRYTATNDCALTK